VSCLLPSFLPSTSIASTQKKKRRFSAHHASPRPLLYVKPHRCSRRGRFTFQVQLRDKVPSIRMHEPDKRLRYKQGLHGPVLGISAWPVRLGSGAPAGLFRLDDNLSQGA
jgi:hypothetical protein